MNDFLTCVIFCCQNQPFPAERCERLSDAKIKVLEKGLDYALIENKINEPELRNDLNEFCRRMHLKWYFCNNG